jgi:hypothetical protein
MNVGIWKHIKAQPFVSATAFAALVHSTWSLGTLFAGQAPGMQWMLLRTDPGAFALNMWDVAYWFFPAFAIAFALDVGQVVTAHDIQRGERNWRKYATFFVFALATYYLQFVYIAHHFPALALGDGVAYPNVVDAVRNAGLWIIPALLPLSTMLYTFSHQDATHARTPDVRTQNPRNALRIAEPRTQEEDTQEVRALPDAVLERSVMSIRSARATPRAGASGGPATGALEDAMHANADGTYTAQCPHCTRAFTKPTRKAARMSLTAHMSKHKDTSA